MLWLITLPLALIGEYGWIATPAMAFLFLNVEQIALEIEQPSTTPTTCRSRSTSSRSKRRCSR